MAWGVSEVWATPHRSEFVRVETWPCSSVESRHSCKGVFHNSCCSICHRISALCSRWRTLYGMEREGQRNQFWKMALQLCRKSTQWHGESQKYGRHLTARNL